MEKTVDKKLKMNNGRDIYFIGIGTHMLQDHNDINDIILSAIGLGYKRIDCSEFYKQEYLIAQSVVSSFLSREEVFISSVIWAMNPKIRDPYNDIRRIISDLRLTYVDLLTIVGKSKYWINSYEALVDSQKKGLVKSIGVKDYSIKQLLEIKKTFGEFPSIYQMTLNNGVNKKEIFRFCVENNIIINFVKIFSGGKKVQHKLIKFLSEKYRATPHQIIIKWAEQRNTIINPRTNRVVKLAENIATNGFKLTNDELQEIDNLKW